MNILCTVFGHKKVKGEIMRSPYAVHTHWQDTTCKRCGEYLSAEKFYFDAIKDRHMFVKEGE